MSEKGWIGVDLDGTLAHYEGWKGIEHIGAPIAPMVDRVKRWIEEGREVRIFTARVAGLFDGSDADPFRSCSVVGPIQTWCHQHIGRVLPITNVKDFGMVELWDDRAVQVVTNTGDCLLDSVFADVGLLLAALGKPNVARPISAHEVMLECIEAVKNIHRDANRAGAVENLRLKAEAAELRAWHERSVQERDRAILALEDGMALARKQERSRLATDAKLEILKEKSKGRDAVEYERKRLINLLCDRCKVGEPVVEATPPMMGLGHTNAGSGFKGWGTCRAEEIHADLRSRSTTSNPCERCGTARTKAEGGKTFTVCDDCWARMGEEYLRTHPSESPSLTRLKAAQAGVQRAVDRLGDALVDARTERDLS